jgi:hypothetical protein
MMADTNNKNADLKQNEYMLTTFDNPYDPFTQFEEWFSWDIRAGYNSSGLLERVSRTSDEISEVDQHLALQQAIDEIVRENVSGMHKKIKRGDLTPAT